MSTHNQAQSALYPGSFDPPTLGHLDIIRRAARIFRRLLVGVLWNADKNACFSPEERMTMLREATAGIAGVEIVSFDGLLVHYLQREGLRVVVRGIRAYTDFESELQMALLNRALLPDMETLFMIPAPEYGIISSRRVLEIASLGGEVSHMVPPNVAAMLARRFPARQDSE
ncbi:pantetheine-phosphate adenylyltransferase [bacterium]|nr:pantetheine-phosphate adenylyltransferase [bacterium]